jgi:uncharacterized protein YegJ (DUF2314 family)
MKPKKNWIGAALAVFAVLMVVFLVSTARPKPSRVIRINSANMALQQSIVEARKGLPDFERHLLDPQAGERFAVKGAFDTSQGKEYLWVRSPKFANGAFTGTLDQRPIALVGKSQGDSVTVQEKDAVDWIIKTDDETKGAYTEKALAEQR